MIFQARYYSVWDRILRLARSFPSDPEIAFLRGKNEHYTVIGVGKNRTVAPCGVDIKKPLFEVLIELKDVQSLRNLAHVFTPAEACAHLTVHLDTWREKVEREVKAIKPFITYL